LTGEAPAGEPAIAYTYDDSNNRKSMTVDGVSSTAYVYDGNNRLTEETKNAGQFSETTHYSYDNNGNTICKYTETISPATQGQTAEVDISTTGAAEEITSAGTDYIGTGFPETASPETPLPETVPEITTGQALSLEAQVPGTGESSNEVNNDNSVTINEYNGLNQLLKVTDGSNTYSYTYNWDGLRASKTINGVATSHIWDGDQMVLETDGAGKVVGCREWMEAFTGYGYIEYAIL